MLWAAVKCFQAKLLTGLRKQLETVSKQLPSPCQGNLFPDHKNFPVSFSVVLHFYQVITTADKKKTGWENIRVRLLCRFVMILNADQKNLISILLNLCISMYIDFTSIFPHIKCLTKLARLLSIF